MKSKQESGKRIEFSYRCLRRKAITNKRRLTDEFIYQLNNRNSPCFNNGISYINDPEGLINLKLHDSILSAYLKIASKRGIVSDAFSDGGYPIDLLNAAEVNFVLKYNGKLFNVVDDIVYFNY